MASSKLNILQKWFDENKIQWDKTSFEITEVSSGNFGVRALKDMSKDTPVVKIPKECILSIKTCGISNIIDEQDLEGGCPLALAVLYEMAQGKSSPWYGYLQSLPENEDLPIFWTSDEKALLKGTEMDAAIQNDMNDLEDDYKVIIEPILEAYPYVFKHTNEDYSFERFLKVTTLISSRAFQVDAYHENALVPFADLFNHDQKEHVHFETEFDVCDACGVLEYCEHQYLDMLESDEEREEMEKELLENGDIDEDQEIVEEEDIEEDIEDESEEDDEEEEDEEEEEEELDTELPDLEELEKAGVDFWDSASSDDTKIDTCDMILDRDVLKNEEVYNTYGDHPNIALLSKYGFCFDDNKNDYVSVSEDALVDCCIALTMEKMKRSENDDAELEQRAVEYTGPRYSFFLEHEQTLCPSGEDDSEEEEEEHDDYQDDDDDDACQDECCPSGDEEHAHHDHTEEGGEHEHEHDEDGGCCGGGDDDEHSQVSRPYYINSEGLFEDKVMCLLHIMFVDQDTFESFTKDFGNALEYFEALSNDKETSGKKKTKKLNETKRTVYQLCHALVDLRRNDYLDENDEWKPVSEEIEEREKYANNNMRKYYGLTCRIGEKKIIERALEYYESQFKGITTHKSDEHPKKETANKRRKL